MRGFRMYVDDELIENLRKAVEKANLLLLLSAASEILQQSEVAASATRLVDCEGDEWFRQADGHWCLMSACDYLPSEAAAVGHGRTLEYINEHYGPTRPVN